MRGARKSVTERARSLRQMDNDAEHKLWQALRNRQLNGYKFIRQYPINVYFADFACRDRMLVVEVDGSQHANSPRDAHRNRLMCQSGWSVLRFWNTDVLCDTAGVLDTILSVLDGGLTEQVDAYDLRFYPARPSKM
jgi:very-short-patch-repair endonuclease